MSKAIIFITLLLFVTCSFGQQTTNTSVPKPNTDYLQKSKKQKTTAWILLAGGTVLTTIGAGVALSGGLDCAFDDPDCGNDQTLASILIISGSAAILGSIPLFIASGKNKRKAASLSFNNIKMLQIKNSSLVYKPMPAVSLKINL
jgi:hypothetical protein